MEDIMPTKVAQFVSLLCHA